MASIKLAPHSVDYCVIVTSFFKPDIAWEVCLEEVNAGHALKTFANQMVMLDTSSIKTA